LLKKSQSLRFVVFAGLADLRFAKQTLRYTPNIRLNWKQVLVSVFLDGKRLLRQAQDDGMLKSKTN